MQSPSTEKKKQRFDETKPPNGTDCLMSVSVAITVLDDQLLLPLKKTKRREETKKNKILSSLQTHK